MIDQPYTPSTWRAWVEVDLGAIVRNAQLLARRCGVPLLPMVKADAYGLGAVEVARALERVGPWGFGVATVSEGAELRAAHIERPIVIFTPLPRQSLPAVHAANLTPTLHRAEDIEAWRAVGGGDWHLAIDTGMNRAGVPWYDVGELSDVLRLAPPSGVFSHFHSSARDDGTRDLQEARFRDALSALPAVPPLVHLENSAAIERGGRSRYPLTRPGIFLYGVDSGAALRAENVVAVRARVVDLRTVRAGDTVGYDGSWTAGESRRIATLSVGYGDGLRRALSNRGHVLLHGVSVPVIGLVTMDMTMVDVTEVPCGLGDVVTVLGADEGANLSLAVMAAEVGISPYELLIGVHGRLPRLYFDSQAGGAPTPAETMSGSLSTDVGTP